MGEASREMRDARCGMRERKSEPRQAGTSLRSAVNSVESCGMREGRVNGGRLPAKNAK